MARERVTRETAMREPGARGTEAGERAARELGVHEQGVRGVGAGEPGVRGAEAGERVVRESGARGTEVRGRGAREPGAHEQGALRAGASELERRGTGGRGAAAPTGLGRRGRRLSDTETERRMLAAAAAMVHRTGLTVSLDHISFEDVIRDADVSRSAVYRRWPYKDLFFSDLVRELAQNAVPEIIADEVAMIRRVVAEHRDWLETAELRRALVVELFRQLALLDFQTLYASARWRTYLALHATFLSIADGTLRDQVQEALARSERDHLAMIAASWERLAGLFGFRLRPELGASYPMLAALLSATMRGLVLMALSMPGFAEQRVLASPFGAAGDSEWSLPSLGLAGLASAFLEPEPGFEWSHARTAAIGEALDQLAP
ncbi:MAG TPA: TetR/AcrR family transcriptional regulator [Streptosporangiaceae bacterium]|nr:TetR/AcrR family transcriptional regulator [Streptosporangiaceae bacterium]